MSDDNQQTTSILLDNDVLRMAYEKESDRIRFYQQLTLRFLPFNLGISRLMKELAKESEERLRLLLRLSHSEEAQERRMPAEAYLPSEEKANGLYHFFVVDSLMAVNVLELAWQKECGVKRFYEDLCSRSATCAWDAVLGNFIKQAKRQACIVQECKDQAYLLGQWRRDQGVLRRIV